MDVPVTTLNEQSGPENIEKWDSFNGLVLVDEIENHFNVKFSLEEIIDVKTVEDIKKHLKTCLYFKIMLGELIIKRNNIINKKF